MSEIPAIRIENLQKSVQVGFWGRRVPLLNGINLSVSTGTIFGFIGQNGAGKSTTIKHLIAVLTPDSGKVQINGEDPRNARARRAIGYLPELPRLPMTATPLEMLRLHSELLGLDSANIAARSRQLLERVELEKDANKALTHFSKGMLQRMGLAIALVGDPQILILDEPMSGLDPYGRQLVREILLEQQALNRTVFFSSHILSDIESLCENVCVIHDGETVAQGELQHILPSTSLGYELRGKYPSQPEQQTQLRALVQNFAFEIKGQTFFVEISQDPFSLATQMEKNGIQEIEIIKTQDPLEARLQNLLNEYSKEA